jgi:putative intracellular protease/amidase
MSTEDTDAGRPTSIVDTVWYVVFDGLSDWECGLALAEINKCDHYRVRTCGLGTDPVVTIGGVRIVPDADVAEVAPGDVAMLIIPGGERFENEDDPHELISLVKELHQRKIPIAAICGATLLLARAGVLDELPHTSNDRNLLETGALHYHGRYQYRSQPAVTGEHVITASGVASVELAYEIIKQLRIYPPDQAEAWFRLFKNYELPG